MNTKDFIQFIEKPSTVTNIDLQQLESVIENFPYFQSARMLFLKNLKIKNNFQFNSYLKETAAFVGDRSVLFEYITQVNEEVILDEKKPILKEEKVEEVEISSSKEEKIPTKTTSIQENTRTKPDDDEDKEAHQTLAFTKDDKFSFNEWLQLSNVREIHRAIDEKIAKNIEISNIIKEVDPSRKSKFDLIDKFIDSKPKLRPNPNKDGISDNIALSGSKENDGWMTETLAQVYIEQNKYSKAIKAYTILSLKYPEKSGFFADQIRSIKKLTDH